MGTNRKFVRNGGTFYDMDNNLANRTLAEAIDDHQLSIFELMKSMFPDADGYEARAVEENGELTTKFTILKRKEGNG